MFQQLAGAGFAVPGPEAGEKVDSQAHLITEAELLSAREEGAARVVDRLVEVLAGSSSLLQEKPSAPLSTKGAEDVRIMESEDKGLPLVEQVRVIVEPDFVQSGPFQPVVEIEHRVGRDRVSEFTADQHHPSAVFIQNRTGSRGVCHADEF